ncbi:NACHT domain-containing protein [Streptomyces specialis]|uniref:NACHT domain-containing protein n=1 Tax=Streptomyces specialis TaxID=498367 RepID=UPI00099E2FFE|nr:NACHT domain-containing protein [Streptomyces specialis]
MRIIGGGSVAVALAVATGQILVDGKLSWEWLYLSLLLAVVLARAPADPTAADAGVTVPGRRRAYLRQLRASVRDMETVGVSLQNPFVLRMRQVYVDVSLMPNPRQAVAREPFLGSVPPAQEAVPGRRRTLQSFLEAPGGRVLAVIGGPGSGKTTLARNTALKLSEKGLLARGRRKLPVLMYLRDHAAAILSEEAPGLAEVATEAGWLAGKVPPAWLERRLDRGRCLVLLDGLDEVADERDRGRVVAWVRRQVERYPDNIFVVTSRPHGYQSNPLPTAEVLQVRRFTGAQIRQFLHGWSYATESRARDCTGPETRAAAVEKAEDLLGRLRRQPALYDLAANPLLLTMIADVHRYRGALPRSRAELYAEMCVVLVHRRYETRGLTDATTLTGPQKERIVRQLALAMMRDGLRDIPAGDAVKVIRKPLRQVSRQLTPEAFLDEVRRSGLLVEREHGVYAFAHLTLQEYLAAAQIGDARETGLLTDKVNDPWWRETTLLWSANADATPVLRACLDSDTVRALALAFDCAEEAAEIDPDTRGVLETLLDKSREPDIDGAGPDRHRLLTAVAATRSLRDVIRVGEDIGVCARPVTAELWSSFVRAEQAAGRYTPHPDGTRDDGHAPATGMWAGDAARFVEWLNGLFDDGTTYRLPTPAELSDPAIGLILDATRHTIWTRDARAQPTAGVRLHQPDGAPWPYTLSPEQITVRVTADRVSTTPYLRLALTSATERDLILPYSRTLATALQRAPEIPRPDLRPLEAILGTALAHTLAHGLARALAGGRGEALVHDLARARLLASHLDPALARALDIELGLNLGLPPGPFPDRHLALTLAQALARVLDRALDLDRGLDLAHGLAFDLARRLDHSRALGRARSLARTLALDLSRALRHAWARGFDPGLESGADLRSDLGPGTVLALIAHAGRAGARELARELDLDRDLDMKDPALPLQQDLNLTLDLALDLALDRSPPVPPHRLRRCSSCSRLSPQPSHATA